jgi:hypothetical protein
VDQGRIGSDFHVAVDAFLFQFCKKSVPRCFGFVLQTRAVALLSKKLTRAGGAPTTLPNEQNRSQADNNR